MTPLTAWAGAALSLSIWRTLSLMADLIATVSLDNSVMVKSIGSEIGESTHLSLMATGLTLSMYVWTVSRSVTVGKPPLLALRSSIMNLIEIVPIPISRGATHALVTPATASVQIS